LGVIAICSLLAFVVSRRANTLFSIKRGEATLSLAEFFTKEDFRPDSTSLTLSFRDSLIRKAHDDPYHR
jgi:hypothetical protein